VIDGDDSRGLTAFPCACNRPTENVPFAACGCHFVSLPRAVPLCYSYDWLGLRNMSADELHQTVLRYETHAVDPVTGQTTDAPGGYQ